ncbi:MAG: MFS transporter [candidate division Zixibacteria bacterium]|nr:MFS transporter [candidate division Zixibacteria bacterium]
MAAVTATREMRKAQIGWIIYDFANTIFSMNIVTYFFASWLINELALEDIYFSLAYSASMLAVALTLPALGRRADHHGTRLDHLLVFTLLCVGFTELIALTALLQSLYTALIVVILVLFAAANYFYEGGLTFYNALISDVSTPENIGKISGLGTGIGYAGSLCGLLMVYPLSTLTIWPGVSGSVYTFLPTALLFALFAIPTFLWVKERPAVQGHIPARESFWVGLRRSLKETRDYPGLLRFMIGNFLIADAVNTVILYMSVYSQSAVGFVETDKLILFAVSTTVALFGSILFGYITDWLKAKTALMITAAGWVVCLLAASVAASKAVFFVIGGLVGIFLGAVWTTSRPLLNSLAPAEKLGQFYGVLSLCSKAAAIVGPLLWGLVVLFGKSDQPLGQVTLDWLGALGIGDPAALAGSIHHRLALVAQVVPMLIGLWVLRKLPNRRRYQAP